MITLVGFVVLVLGAVLGSSYRGFWIFAVIGFALFLGGSLYQACGIRCPRCQSRLDLYSGQTPAMFSIPSRYRFCPCCGVDLDIQLDTTQRV